MRAGLFKTGRLRAAVFFIAGIPTLAAADPVIALHGFIGTSFYWQDQNFIFGNGQNAEVPVPATPGQGNDLSGSDVRNTRLWIDIAEPAGDGAWTASAHLEGDFFGGFNGTGPFSSEQESPRLRMAYFNLSDAASGSAFRIGQQWNLLFPSDNVSESYTHIAFPPALAVGLIGWRFPGVVWSQELPAAGGADWRLDLGVFEGSWNGPGNDINAGSAGNAGFHPQLEARLHVEDGDLLGYVVLHYSREDLTGVGGTAPAPLATGISSHAYEGGLRWQSEHWVLHAGAYTGRGLGSEFGALVQFGDIAEWGGYVQLGYKFTPEWALYGSYGRVLPNQKDVIAWVTPSAAAPSLLGSRQFATDLLYNAGSWGLGFEWLRAITRYTADPAGRGTAETGGAQWSVSALFRF